MSRCCDQELLNSWNSFGTTDGFINDGETISTPTIMFVAAMDALFDKLDKRLLKRIKDKFYD